MSRTPDVRTSSARRRSTARRASALALALGVVLLTSGCVKAGISPKAHAVHGLFYIILWLALPVFIFVEGMLLLCIVRYRRRRGDDREPIQDYGNNRALMAFFAGPLVIVIILLAFGESTEAKVDANAPHPAQRVTITGVQWAWSAQYAKGGFTVSGHTLGKPMVMELPVNEDTRVTLKATDVIHEFYLPDLLFMKNAVPGHPNVFTIKPTKLGTFKGQCAQYCGLWHAQMRFVLKVVTPAQFHKWAESKEQGSGPGTCTPTGSAVTLTAHHIAWDKKCIAVDAGKPFQVTIVNNDSGIAHNFAIWQSSKLKKLIYVTKDVTGVATKTFTAPALPAGTYYFQCNIHGPAMSGTLIVGPPK